MYPRFPSVNTLRIYLSNNTFVRQIPPNVSDLAAKFFAGKERTSPKILSGVKIVTKEAKIPGTSKSFVEINLAEALKRYNKDQPWGYD
ncbi:MAG: hypothetical protein ChlgKO_00030 [Chlamydiales bacterium]